MLYIRATSPTRDACTSWTAFKRLRLTTVLATSNTSIASFPSNQQHLYCFHSILLSFHFALLLSLDHGTTVATSNISIASFPAFALLLLLVRAVRTGSSCAKALACHL